MAQNFDVVIIGAGAAGLMCAATAGYQGRKVLLIDHANKAGKKILMSGGGRCNFTNLNSTPANFFSQNPSFCISALKRYSPQDFLELVERHSIQHVEKAAGQLFCAGSESNPGSSPAKDILNMLLTECEWAGVEIRLKTQVDSVELQGEAIALKTSGGDISAGKLVVATGGLSIPTMGATGFGYDIARQFGLEVLETSAALVPFVLTSQWKDRLEPLAGVAVDVEVTAGKGHYREPMLITHRGLSGPAMLQISSWWKPGDALTINLLPEMDLNEELVQLRFDSATRRVGGWLAEYLPKSLAQAIVEWEGLAETNFADLSNARIQSLQQSLNAWQIKPAGTEGWRTAEVTMGGVATDSISQQNFEVKDLPQLAFIGEVLDVTGELGGHNFQWAWASAVACGLSC
jgi:predicted Rossmann fold flavoprotein